MLASRWIAAGLLGASSAAAAPPADGSGPLEPVPRGTQPLVIATDGSPPPPAPEPRPLWPGGDGWHDGVAFGVGFGAAFVQGVDPGFFGRVDVGAYEIQHRRRGLIAGMLMGVEGWRASGPGDGPHWGGSLPVILFGGIQSDAFFAVLGGGFDLLLIDRVERDTGVGFLAPEASADLGFDLEGVRFLVDARAGYRWQLGADDRSSLRLGGVIQLTTD